MLAAASRGGGGRRRDGRPDGRRRWTPRLRRGRTGPTKRRAQDLVGDPHGRLGRQAARTEPVRLAQAGNRVRAGGKPLGDPLERLAACPMLPAVRACLVAREERAHDRQLPLGRKQAKGDPVADSREQPFHVAVRLAHFGGVIGRASHPPAECDEALPGLRHGLEIEVALVHQSGAIAVGKPRALDDRRLRRERGQRPGENSEQPDACPDAKPAPASACSRFRGLPVDGAVRQRRSPRGIPGRRSRRDRARRLAPRAAVRSRRTARP